MQDRNGNYPWVTPSATHPVSTPGRSPGLQAEGANSPQDFLPAVNDSGYCPGRPAYRCGGSAGLFTGFPFHLDEAPVT